VAIGAVRRAIQAAMDPDNILNPGKVVALGEL
jgi:FAD/FMN-containing dehydrogenase